MPVSSLLMSSLSSGGSGGGNGALQGISNTAAGLISGITGFFQKRQANKLLNGLSDPVYSIPPEILRNQKMAEINANQGLPSQQYANAMKNIQRSQANAIAGAQDRRSALMALPKIQQQANDAALNLDSADAQARRQNLQTLYNVGNVTAGYRDKQFQYNQVQPFQRKYSYGMQLLGAGNQNFTSGLDKLVAGAGQIAYGTPKGYSSQQSSKDTFGAFQ